MIRPITCVTFLLACGSGLYLYQAKHRVYVLDSQIEQVVRQTDQVREQTRVLHAEWTLLDQPDRLQQLAGQFLTLQPTKPAQFASAADLDSRLPAPLPPETEQEAAPPAAEAPPLVASPLVANAPTSPEPGKDVAETRAQPRREPVVAALSAPPLAAPVRVAEHAVVHVPDHAAEPARAPLIAARMPPAPVPMPRPQLVMAQPARLASAEAPRPPQPRLVSTALPRPMTAPQRPAYPSTAPRYAAVPAYGGSMLGMARDAAPPPPAPMWINWNNR